jgi:uncharacterized protein YndB with AHSA1/START domain
MTSQNNSSLEFSQTIHAPVAQVYRAFTNETALREWLCDVAVAHPSAAGRLYLAWDSGYYASGEYTALMENQEVSFSWIGRAEPGVTQVTVTIKQQGGAAVVSLQHAGFGDGTAWDATRSEHQKGWKTALENLGSVLENGKDLRIVRRPMLGILYADLDQHIAQQIGVPVHEGARLGGAVEGMGPAKAGLGKDDVLVELAGMPVVDWASLGPILQKHRAGDQVSVVYYRGAEKHQVDMVLSSRPIPEIPWTAAGLAAHVKKDYDQGYNSIATFLSGVSEAEAAFKPSPEAWSMQETLCHLVQGERDFGAYVVEQIGSQVRYSDDYAGNIMTRIQATLLAYPSVAELLAAWQKLMAENVALLENLPEEFLQRKSSYWRLAYELTQPPYHNDEHLAEMRLLLEKARQV